VKQGGICSNLFFAICVSSFNKERYIMFMSTVDRLAGTKNMVTDKISSYFDVFWRGKNSAMFLSVLTVWFLGQQSSRP